MHLYQNSNFGQPILEKGAKIHAAASEISPFNDYAKGGLKSWQTYLGPTKDFDETDSKTHHYSSEVSGASVNIYAHHHDGSKTKVSSFGIKNKGSSPFSGIVGRVGDVAKTKTTMRVRIKKKKSK